MRLQAQAAHETDLQHIHRDQHLGEIRVSRFSGTVIPRLNLSSHFRLATDPRDRFGNGRFHTWETVGHLIPGTQPKNN